MKRRRGTIGILFLLVLIAAVSSWQVYREVRQQRLNRDLIAALMRADVPAEVRLLDEGADANARDIEDNEVSFKGVLRGYWQRLHTGKPIEKESYLPALLLAGVIANDLEMPIPDAKRIEMIVPLLDHGADINSRDKNGNTLLWHVCYNYMPRTARLLIERGANVNGYSGEGYTPLMWAVDNNHPDIVRALLQAGANINAKDYEHHTALSYAQGFNHKEIIRILQQAGAHE